MRRLLTEIRAEISLKIFDPGECLILMVDSGLLKQLTTIISESGKMYFTTLVRANRFADKYLEALADSGKLVSRNATDHKKVFEQVGLSAEYESTGNILVIKGNKYKENRAHL